MKNSTGVVVLYGAFCVCMVVDAGNGRGVEPWEGRGREAWVVRIPQHTFWTKMSGDDPDSFPLPHTQTSLCFLPVEVAHFKSRQLRGGPDKAKFCLVPYLSLPDRRLDLVKLRPQRWSLGTLCFWELCAGVRFRLGKEAL